MLTTLFFFLLFFLLGAESDDDESDESYDDGSGSRFTLGSCFLIRAEVFLIESFDHLFESFLIESQYSQYSRYFPAQILL